MNARIKTYISAAVVAVSAFISGTATVHAAGEDFNTQRDTVAKLLLAQTQANCPAMPNGLVKLYRLYNSEGKDHLYTTDAAERDQAARSGYRIEGSVGFVFDKQVPNTKPLYRLYKRNGSDHFYTIDENERQKARGGGYAEEGITGYVYTSADALDCYTTPFYRMFKGGIRGDHFYTTDSVERAKAAKQDGYSYERIEGFLVQDPDAVKAQKNPVIIVGGTLALELIYWTLEVRLTQDGYYHRFFQLPELGTIDIRQSADALKTMVDTVLRETGAEKVHLIGHSQGSTVARTYIHKHNAYNLVDSMISLGGPHKGTRFTETFAAKLLGCPKAPPCGQMSVGSSLLAEINNGRPANDPVYYTNFVTNNDVFVVPRENGFMDNCDRVNELGEPLRCNIHVQANCPNRFLEHIGLASDGTVYSGIRLALEHREIVLNCRAF